jgi:hypothetical protein
MSIHKNNLIGAVTTLASILIVSTALGASPKSASKASSNASTAHSLVRHGIATSERRRHRPRGEFGFRSHPHQF